MSKFINYLAYEVSADKILKEIENNEKI